MHDLNYFREHLDVFAEMAKKRGTTLDLDAFRTLDKERRELITTTEQLKAQRNKEAHTHVKGVTRNINAPSLTMAQFQPLYEGLCEFDRVIRKRRW